MILLLIWLAFIDVNIYPVNIAIKHPPIKANHIKSSIIQPPVVIY